MPVSLEPVIWIVRGGDEHARFGDPFTAAVVAIKVDEQTVRLAGLTGAITPAVYRACREAFAALGITVFRRTRHKSSPLG